MVASPFSPLLTLLAFLGTWSSLTPSISVVRTVCGHLDGFYQTAAIPPRNISNYWGLIVGS